MVWSLMLLKPWITVTEKQVFSPQILEDLEATRELLLQTGVHFGSCKISAVIKKIVPNVNANQQKAQLPLFLLLVLRVAT